MDGARLLCAIAREGSIHYARRMTVYSRPNPPSRRAARNAALFVAVIIQGTVAAGVSPSDLALIEDDWRKQDGIGVQRAAATYSEALTSVFARGDLLVRDLMEKGVVLEELHARWENLRREWQQILDAHPKAEEVSSFSHHSEDLWRRVHRIRREIVFANPLTQTGPILFVKQNPGIFSHQLTQYYGSCARPGGGLFVLDHPGHSLESRALIPEGALPQGSYQHPEVSFDGQKVLFSFCAAESVPKDRESHLERFYHLYEINVDGTGLRRLTSGPYDDFSPKYLPSSEIIFISTRRGGFHRCGRGPCPTYTLAKMNADGSNPRPISFHETHEWDPAVMWNGQIIYTRWDYVDRHAVFYQQLWTARPDGTGAVAYYGNNTFNPVGVWEARPVPHSNQIMATAAAHHAMTAGSIILIDITQGREGLGPITRLTPDALFPESESAVANLSNKSAWIANLDGKLPVPPLEMQRWPGHCYRSPYPLDNTCFLAAYSFDSLIGEPDPNPAAMFGVYLVDRFGNKELLHRDTGISSLWPVPLGPRPAPQELASVLGEDESEEGTLLMQDVYQSWPALPDVKIERLRVMQVLPKSTWHINDPPVGLANASPGRQVLGTVPVETDGSAWFRAPAKVALAFQVLDEYGQAVQTMRSIAYLQPGEASSCVGCHEPRHSTPTLAKRPKALDREPSVIEPGPDGSRPLSYPLLVQPVLDRHCISCHNPEKREGGLVLTGDPDGRFTASYNVLAARTVHSAWGGQPGDFRVVNSEPVTQPGFFGARSSSVLKMLRNGHHDVMLSRSDIERLATWMDANSLFYGTFEREDQARQLRGERIAGPALE
jgi:hypothetical protein